MSAGWNNADADLVAVAERVLTPRQLEIVKLYNSNYGIKRIARVLGITASTVKGHLAAAELKMLKALDKQGGQEG